MDPNSVVTPAIVRGYNKATTQFLCPLSANTYGIKFLKYKIRDMISGLTLIEMDSSEEEIDN
jgi:hypothetical protein